MGSSPSRGHARTRPSRDAIRRDQYAARVRIRVAVIVLAACGSTPPTTPPSGHPTKGSEVRIDDLLREASEAHAKHLPLDDRAPFEVPPVADARDVTLYLDACHAGDHPACWIAMELALQDAHARVPKEFEPSLSSAGRDAVAMIEQNCRAGDHMSCVALPVEDKPDNLRFPDVPGAVGRSHACQYVWDGTNADRCAGDKLRAECDEGFARSCRAAGQLSDFLANRALKSPAPHDDLDKRENELDKEGCRARIVSYCGSATKDDPDNYFEAATACDLGQHCSRLAAILLERGKKLEARDAAERGCQFFRDRCAELGVMYIDGTLPETTPGRGQRLVDFVCESVRRTNGEKMMQGYKPCARMTGAAAPQDTSL